ncbi:MAG TPA: class I SAM-dependent methyltransferase [bacterium]|nr:class I SAM-dependent methyltransferase [bacterium]
MARDVDHRSAAYYEDKLAVLRDLWGTPAVSLERGCLVVRGRRYPIVDDVIVLLEPSQYPPRLAQRLQDSEGPRAAPDAGFAPDIQYTFGEEWSAFPDILPEHEREFQLYFDLIDLGALRAWRVCDLGCGIGRWSLFLSRLCREIVLVDFSDAIFVARRNLAAASNALFFMGDLTKLEFRYGFADLVVCLGVLHHLPTPALTEVRSLRRWSRRLLVYLYYALDNRPVYFRWLLGLVGGMRAVLSRLVRNPGTRGALTWLLAGGLYLPLIGLGGLLRPVGWSRHVPLYETYAGKGLVRIRQDVYDRFFTRIEQRYAKRDILTLADAFSTLIVSEHSPYWHFYCEQ